MVRTLDSKLPAGLEYGKVGKIVDTLLRYGRRGLRAAVPLEATVDVLLLPEAREIADGRRAVERGLEAPLVGSPLAALLGRRKTACVVISDVMRPVPDRLLLPPILAAVEAGGISRENVCILVGTGLHRRCVVEELAEMLGEEILNEYRVENHAARNAQEHLNCGFTSQGVPVAVDVRYMQADLKICTGLVEPHLMAGFSGGAKAVCPGICSAQTIQAFHSPTLLAHPRARAGILEDNPVQEFTREVAGLAGLDFLVNVTLNSQRELTGVFVGSWKLAFAAAAEFARATASAPVQQPADVVLTTGGGYPLDATFYQAIKGIVGALPAVRDGGGIVCVAECSEGMGGPEFRGLLGRSDSLAQALDTMMVSPEITIDQWQFQELCMAEQKAKVYFVSDGLSEQEKSLTGVECIGSVEEALLVAIRRHGPRVAVIPDGPYVLPVASRETVAAT